MINNKKGISGIILTIIMIGLVLVAVGIVWYVVNNVLTEQTESIDYASKCSGLIFNVNILSTDGNMANMTIERAIGSKGTEIDGFEITFTNDGGASNTRTEEQDITTIWKNPTITAGVNDATQADVRIFFNKEDNTKHYCSNIFSSAD